MQVEPQKQHQWLQRLLGDWTMEAECRTGPDQPPIRSTGTEVVRPLGDLWIMAEGEGKAADGDVGRAVITLGYDPAAGFVGTFVATMGTHLWVYHGTLNAEETILTLDTEGPNFSGAGMAKYQDIIEIVSPEHRILRSRLLGDHGQWNDFMTAHYHRVK